MRRVINISDTLQKEYARRFNEEHAKPIRASRLQLEHLNSNFEYFNGKIFELIGVVDQDKLCVFDTEDKEFYHVERNDFQDFIISGYINKTETNEL